jgi:hypothetical protein
MSSRIGLQKMDTISMPCVILKNCAMLHDLKPSKMGGVDFFRIKLK